MTTEPRLKKAKKCAGCWAYNEQGGAPYGAYCVLGFAVTQLPEGRADSGRMGAKMYWPFYCRPAEPCYKPLTCMEYVASMKKVHGFQ